MSWKTTVRALSVLWPRWGQNIKRLEPSMETKFAIFFPDNSVVYKAGISENHV